MVSMSGTSAPELLRIEPYSCEVMLHQLTNGLGLIAGVRRKGIVGVVEGEIGEVVGDLEELAGDLETEIACRGDRDWSVRWSLT